ncbi:hypothetical protein WN943_016813 [Citrus x changshan-huyou]
MKSSRPRMMNSTAYLKLFKSKLESVPKAICKEYREGCCSLRFRQRSSGILFTGEVEDQMNSLLELVPEWASEKLSFCGNLLVR